MAVREVQMATTEVPEPAATRKGSEGELERWWNRQIERQRRKAALSR